MRFRTQIEIREGVMVDILVTPALYRVAQRRGIDLGPGDSTDPFTPYIKMAYCAAINAWEVDAVDNPGKGELPYKYADFDEWAWSDKARLAELIGFMYEAITGKVLKEEVADEVKKKTKKTRRG